MKSYNFSCTIMAFQLVDHANSGASLVAHNANITKIHPNKKPEICFLFLFFFLLLLLNGLMWSGLLIQTLQSVQLMRLVWATTNNNNKCIRLPAPHINVVCAQQYYFQLPKKTRNKWKTYEYNMHNRETNERNPL